MDLDARRRELADRHNRALGEFNVALIEWLEASRPDALTGTVWRHSARYKRARFYLRRARRAVRRTRIKRYMR